MRRRLPLLVAAMATAIALAAPQAPAASPCRHADAPPTAQTTTQARRATLCLLNRERARRGLPALRDQRSLVRAAGGYARLMVRERFFDHVSPAGSTMEQRIRATGYLTRARAWAIGENLAWGAGDAASPAGIVDGWMRSPGHRANILSPAFREIGIGLTAGAPDGGPGATYVTEFGSRR